MGHKKTDLIKPAEDKQTYLGYGVLAGFTLALFVILALR